MKCVSQVSPSLYPPLLRCAPALSLRPTSRTFTDCAVPFLVVHRSTDAAFPSTSRPPFSSVLFPFRLPIFSLPRPLLISVPIFSLRRFLANLAPSHSHSYTSLPLLSFLPRLLATVLPSSSTSASLSHPPSHSFTRQQSILPSQPSFTCTSSSLVGLVTVFAIYSHFRLLDFRRVLRARAKRALRLDRGCRHPSERGGPRRGQKIAIDILLHVSLSGATDTTEPFSTFYKPPPSLERRLKSLRRFEPHLESRLLSAADLLDAADLDGEGTESLEGRRGKVGGVDLCVDEA